MRNITRIGLGIAAASAAVISTVGVANAGGSTAVPAGTASWANGSCTATFVRSSSGIVNETNRVCTPADPYALIVQFRPLSGTPNPACDPAGLYFDIPSWTNNPADTQIAKWFGTSAYHVCFYYAPNQQMAAGTVDSANVSGTTATLPTSGNYRIDVSGTWQNGSVSTEDAEFTSVDGAWDDTEDGYNHAPYFLGEGFGDLMVNSAFVNWGAFSPAHAYSLTQALGTSVQLNVFDGDSTGGNTVPNAAWYGDNNGSLSYTITYLGQ